MKRLRRALFIVGWLGVAARPALAQIDPFYLDLERKAATAAARGDAELAARLYRIACFGMLDEPAQLAACTVRLALEQAAARDREGFDESFSRLATVEARFQGLTLAELSSDERSRFARVAGALLPEETWAGIPSVAELLRAERRASAKVAAPPEPVSKRRKPSPATADENAGNPSARPDPPAARAESAAGRTAPTPAPQADSPAAESPPSDALPEAEAAQVEAARALLVGKPDRGLLVEAASSLRLVADRYPEMDGLARMVGDLAYRLADWPLCAEYYTRAGDPGPDEPLDRFYMAVCLYEIGDREAAAALLEPSAGLLKRSPFVDGYLAKILPASELP